MTRDHIELEFVDHLPERSDAIVLLVLVGKQRNQLSETIIKALIRGFAPRDGRWTREDAFSWLVDVIQCPQEELASVLESSTAVVTLIRVNANERVTPTVFTNCIKEKHLTLFLGGVRKVIVRAAESL